jgi:hypothetical protein
LFRGAAVEQAFDVSLPGPVFGWYHRRTYDSRLVESVTGSELSGTNGIRWHSRVLGPYVRGAGTNLVLFADASSKRTFTSPTGTTFTAPADYLATATVSNGGTASEEFVIAEHETGQVFIFYGLNSSVTAQNRSRLKQQTSRQYRTEGLSGIQYTYNLRVSRWRDEKWDNVRGRHTGYDHVE